MSDAIWVLTHDDSDGRTEYVTRSKADALALWTVLAIELCLDPGARAEIRQYCREILLAAVSHQHEEVFNLFRAGLDDNYAYLEPHNFDDPEAVQADLLAHCWDAAIWLENNPKSPED